MKYRDFKMAQEAQAQGHLKLAFDYYVKAAEAG